MRFHKTTADEERLVFVLAEVLDGAVGGVIITVAFAITVQHHDAV